MNSRMALVAICCVAMITTQSAYTAERHEVQQAQKVGAHVKLDNAGVQLTLKAPAGEKLYFKIESVQFDQNDVDKRLFLYTVSVKTDRGWIPLCHPDSLGRRTAIPLNGRWDEKGNFRNSDNITFACTSGVLAKCILWGYAPWDISASGKSMRELHQACTRMARADYCGNGKSYTRNGTSIRIYDNRVTNKRYLEYGRSEDFAFEAAWGPDGAVEIVRTRWGEPLEKIMAECPEKNWIMKSNPRRIVIPKVKPILFNDSRQQRGNLLLQRTKQ